MLLAFLMWIIPYLIIERVKPIEKPICICRQCPYVNRYASKRSMHPTQWGIQIVQFYSLLRCKKYPILCVAHDSRRILRWCFLRRELTGLSPSGKAQHFDCCIRWFESSQPRLPRFLALMFSFFTSLPSSSTELIKGTSNVPDGFLGSQQEVLIESLCCDWWLRIATADALLLAAYNVLLRKFSSVGQNVRLITGKSRVRVPEFPSLS